MKRRWPILVIIALGALVIFVWLEGPLVRLSDPLDPSTERQASAERGQYLFRIAGCAGCHTREDGGAYLAGGRALVSPYGTFFSPNITPDPQTGIGNWTSDDFVYTLREGIGPHGKHYFPAFPFTSYRQMREQDARDIFAYLVTLEPVHQENLKHELPWYLNSRLAAQAWRWLFLITAPGQAGGGQDPTLRRGAYVANALAHCGECHTPRDQLGIPEASRLYAGTKHGPDGEVIPNITPDRATGIGKWSPDDLAYFLKTGMTPGGDYTGSMMAEVIDNGLRHLTDTDRQALVGYLSTLAPVEHNLKKKKKKTRKTRDEFDY